MLHVYQDTPIGGADVLSSLGDVNISTPSEKDALCYDATNNKWVNKSGVLREIVQKTQVEYDALTAEQKHDPTKIYEITDSQTINVDIDDNSIDVGKTWSSSKINSIFGTKILFKSTTTNFPSFNANAAGLHSVSHGIDLTQYKILSITLTSNWAWANCAMSRLGADAVQFLNVPYNGAGTNNVDITCDVLYCKKEDLE